MYCKYGTYQHAANEVNVVSFSQRVKRSSRGLQESTIKTINLEVVLIPSDVDQDAIKDAIEELEEAYGTDGYDFGLYHDDGTVSPHFLDNETSLAGVRVTALDYPRSDGAEYAVQRIATITLEAEYQAASGSNLLAFQESVRYVGDCGPRVGALETLYGEPVFQQLRRRTVQRIVQSGSAMGHLSYPTAPGPLFATSGTLKPEGMPEFNPGSPTYNGVRFVNWPISWSFAFLSIVDVSAVAPNRQ